METNHTPTPYYAIHGDGFSTITNSLEVGQFSSVVARIKNDVSLRPLMPIDRANAEFIVRACNSHDDLVDALSKLVREYKANIDPLDACERAAIDYCEHVITAAQVQS